MSDAAGDGQAKEGRKVSFDVPETHHDPSPRTVFTSYYSKGFSPAMAPPSLPRRQSSMLKGNDSPFVPPPPASHPSHPKAPSVLLPPVLQDTVPVADSGTVAPPRPMPSSAAGGFPVPAHRSVKSYSRKAKAAGGKEATSSAPPTDPASILAAGEFDAPQVTTTELLERVLVEEMEANEDSVAGVIASAAVMLRSQNAAQRTGCLERLLDFPLAEAVPTTEPTVAAQFLMALRMALDSTNITHQRGALEVLDKLVDRSNEARWREELDRVYGGPQLPLKAWLDERTFYGLGKIANSEQGGEDTAELWEALESTHQLASIVKCDILEGLCKLQVAPRLRFFLYEGRHARGRVLRVLYHLTLSSSVAEAFAVTPHFVETVADVVPWGNQADKAVKEHVRQALLLLGNMVRASPPVGGRMIAEYSVLEKLLSILELADGESGVVTSALVLLRVLLDGTLPQAREKVAAMVAGAFPTLSRLLLTSDTAIHAAVLHLLASHADASPQDTFFEFALLDVPQLLRRHWEAEHRVWEFCVSAVRLVTVAGVSLQTSDDIKKVEKLDKLYQFARWLRCAERVCGDAETFHIAADHTPHPASSPSAARWPLFTAERANAVGCAKWNAAVLDFFLAVPCAPPPEDTYLAAIEGFPSLPSSAALHHAYLPKRESRIHAMLLRSEVHMLARAARLVKREKGTCPPPSLLNLTLYMLPGDEDLFRAAVADLCEPYPALAEYFHGACPPPQTGLSLAFPPGRLEPQPEWVFLPTADVTTPDNDPLGKKLVGVVTRGAPDWKVMEEWGEWLSKAMPSYVGDLDWAECALRAMQGAAVPHQVLRQLTERAAVDRSARDEAALGRRLGEAPLQVLQRILRGYQAESCGDEMATAGCLFFLHPAFPPSAAMKVQTEVALDPQLVRFGVLAPPIPTLPWELYLVSPPDVTAEEAQSLAEAPRRFRTPFDPTNILHVRLVHRLAVYLKGEGGDFLTTELTDALPATFYDAVAGYDPSIPLPDPAPSALPDLLAARQVKKV